MVNANITSKPTDSGFENLATAESRIMNGRMMLRLAPAVSGVEAEIGLTRCLLGTQLWDVEFDWDPEKNEKIKRERGVSFEEIALLLGEGRLWKVESHSNRGDYPHQQIFFIPIGDYIYLVPFVQDGETFFLKTAFPSRKATKTYRIELE